MDYVKSLRLWFVGGDGGVTPGMDGGQGGE